MITIIWLIAAIACFGISFTATAENQRTLRWTAAGIVVAGILVELLVVGSINSRMR